MKLLTKTELRITWLIHEYKKSVPVKFNVQNFLLQIYETDLF